jgi:hypothetical protein
VIVTGVSLAAACVRSIAIGFDHQRSVGVERSSFAASSRIFKFGGAAHPPPDWRVRSTLKELTTFEQRASRPSRAKTSRPRGNKRDGDQERGDAANAILTAVGHNLRLILAWLRTLLRLILAALRSALAPDPKLKLAS